MQKKSTLSTGTAGVSTVAVHHLCAFVLFAAILIGLVTPSVIAAPVDGEIFTAKQPDGSSISVKIWGDEFYHRVESLDGYTLTRDSNGWIQYAQLNANASAFVPTSTSYDGQNIWGNSQANTLLGTPGFEKSLRLSPAARNAIIDQRKQDLGYHQLLGAQAPAPLLGSVVGLTICVDFSDAVEDIAVEEIDDYCNLEDYTGFGNNGSIYDYFYDVSGENLEYTKRVATFPCALGRSRRMTPIGTFAIGSKGAWKFWNTGYYSPYYTKYNNFYGRSGRRYNQPPSICLHKDRHSLKSANRRTGLGET